MDDEICVHGINKMDCAACWNLENAIENIGIANLLQQTGIENLKIVQQERRRRNLLVAAILARMFGDE